MLIAAYRTVNNSAWAEKAALGTLGVIASVLLGHVLTILLT
jgi:hypothetical protein